MFFVDGLDVLFRVAFGILQSNEAELLGCASISAVYMALESLPTRTWEVDKLLQVRMQFSSHPIIILSLFGNTARKQFTNSDRTPRYLKAP